MDEIGQKFALVTNAEDAIAGDAHKGVYCTAALEKAQIRPLSR